MRCTNCGSQVSDSSKFCPECGAVIHEEAYESKCIYCASEISLTARFCPECGKEIPTGRAGTGVYQPTETFPKPTIQGEVVPPDRDEPKTKNGISTSVLITIIALIGIILAISAFTVAYLLTDILSDSSKNPEDAANETEKTLCQICEDEIDEDEEYCKKCKEKYTCQLCDEIDENLEDGLCEKCAKIVRCKICNKAIDEDEEYCRDCEDEYTCENCHTVDRSVLEGMCEDCKSSFRPCKNCEKLIESGYYCKRCIKRMAEDTFYITCSYCYNDLDEEEIFLIDDTGRVYCADCDTGNYCKDCGAILDKKEDDDECFGCSDMWCNSCSEVLDEHDYYITDSYGNWYCADCDTEYYCEDCGAPVHENETYCYTCE